MINRIASSTKDPAVPSGSYAEDQVHSSKKKKNKARNVIDMIAPLVLRQNLLVLVFSLVHPIFREGVGYFHRQMTIIPIGPFLHDSS